MATTENKTKICEKYKPIIEFIYIVGDGVILQKQFYILCDKLHLTLSNYHTTKILNELKECQLIKKERLSSSNNNIIILRRFAFRFILNKEYYLPTNIDNRIKLSIFKYDKLIKLIENYNIYYLDSLFDLIYDLNSNILYKRFTGCDYHFTLVDKFNLDFYNQHGYFKSIYNYNTMLNNLYIARSCKFNTLLLNDSLSANSSINTSSATLDDYTNSTIDSLLNLNIYIQSIHTLSSSKIIEICILDDSRKENISRLTRIIHLSCSILNDIFSESKLEFRFTITSFYKRSETISRCLIDKYKVDDVSIQFDYITIK